jgi:hypothetical protein
MVSEENKKVRTNKDHGFRDLNVTNNFIRGHDLPLGILNIGNSCYM